MIKIIVAVSQNMVIGKNGTLPWNLPTDMNHFKKVTTGHSVLMGKGCWESIPEKFRPLPNRDNIVLTRDPNYVAKGAKVVHSLEDTINHFKNSNKTLFIIGGAEIYKESFKHANSMFITYIYDKIEGDVFLEGLDFKEWNMNEISEVITENGLNFSIKYYEKK